MLSFKEFLESEKSVSEETNQEVAVETIMQEGDDVVVEGCKVGDTVTPLVGPHEGQEHKITAINEDDTFIIEPVGLAEGTCKYKSGKAKVKSDQLKESGWDIPEALLDEGARGSFKAGSAAYFKAGQTVAKNIAALSKGSTPEVKLVRLNKDGKESGMHDAASSYSSEQEAVDKHHYMVKVNPGKHIAHNLYVGDQLKGKYANGQLQEKQEEEDMAKLDESAAGFWNNLNAGVSAPGHAGSLAFKDMIAQKNKLLAPSGSYVHSSKYKDEDNNEHIVVHPEGDDEVHATRYFTKGGRRGKEQLGSVTDHPELGVNVSKVLTAYKKTSVESPETAPVKRGRGRPAGAYGTYKKSTT